MPAATITGRKQNRIQGDLRTVTATSVAFANTGDTWTVPGLKTVYEISLTPTTNASYGFTVSGNVITLAAGAGVTFYGSVSGL